MGSREGYEFDGFRLDAVRRVVQSGTGGDRLSLEPRVFDAALHFVRHPGQVLSKECLIAALWPGAIVEENNLTQVVSSLRRALGERRGENRYIATVPRRGYCFVAKVNRRAGDDETGVGDDRSVVVHPFHNLGTQADAWLAVGITESISHRLSRLSGMRLVVPTTAASTGSAEAAGESTRCAPPRFVVNGSLQRAGSQLRIGARLIDTIEARQVWSMLCDRTAQDVFGVQDDVSRRVAMAMRHCLALRRDGGPRGEAHARHRAPRAQV